MSEAAAAQPAPLPQTLEALAALLGDLAAENRRLFEEAVRISRAPMSQDDRNVVIMLVHRAADVEGIERAVLDRLNQEVRLRTVEELWQARQPELAPVPEPGPRPRRHRHRAARRHNPDQPPLWGLPSLVPVAAAVALRPLGAALRHSGHALRNPLGHLQAAHHAAAAWTAAGVAAVGGAAVVVASVVPSGPPAHASGAYPGTARAPSGITASAVPATSPSHRARPGLDAKAAGPNDPAGASGPLPGSYVPPGDPSAQDPPPPVQVAGTLQVNSAGLDLGVAYAGTVTVTAVGGPVSWGAVRGSDAIALDSARGDLAAGQSATIGITVSTAAQLPGGSATLRIWPGNVMVTVSWPALPVPVDVPSAVASVVPPVSVSVP